MIYHCSIFKWCGTSKKLFSPAIGNAPDQRGILSKRLSGGVLHLIGEEGSIAHWKLLIFRITIVNWKWNASERQQSKVQLLFFLYSPTHSKQLQHERVPSIKYAGCSFRSSLRVCALSIKVTDLFCISPFFMRSLNELREPITNQFQIASSRESRKGAGSSNCDQTTSRIRYFS